MGLLATELTLTDFRSAHERRVELAPATTVLVGPNASGKTNTVEALQMLTAGFSFRKPTPAQLVREGAPRGRADLRLEGDGRVLDVRCDVEAGGVRSRATARRFTPATSPGT